MLPRIRSRFKASAQLALAVLGIALFTSVAAPNTLAEEYPLFNASGEQVSHYDDKVAVLRPGDTIVFGAPDNGGHRFKITQVLGHGRTTKILKLEDGRAIRIPLRSGLFHYANPKVEPKPYTWFVTTFLEGFEALQETGTKTVKVYADESVPGQFAIVDTFQERFDLRHYLKQRPGLPSFIRESIDLDLIEFIKSTWAFRYFGDELPEQVIYAEGLGWILADWTNEHGFAELNGRERFPLRDQFDAIFKKRLTEEIRKEREQHRQPELPSFLRICKRLLTGKSAD